MNHTVCLGARGRTCRRTPNHHSSSHQETYCHRLLPSRSSFHTCTGQSPARQQKVSPQRSHPNLLSAPFDRRCKPFPRLHVGRSQLESPLISPRRSRTRYLHHRLGCELEYSEQFPTGCLAQCVGTSVPGGEGGGRMWREEQRHDERSIQLNERNNIQ